MQKANRFLSKRIVAGSGSQAHPMGDCGMFGGLSGTTHPQVPGKTSAALGSYRGYCPEACMAGRAGNALVVWELEIGKWKVR